MTDMTDFPSPLQPRFLRRGAATILPVEGTGDLSIAEFARAQAWRDQHGRTFEIPTERPKRLCEVHPVRESCIEWAAADPDAHWPAVATYGHWEMLRRLVEKGRVQP